ncbi:MAG: glycosyltransferase [Coleofasciculaceae cyanobacterium]
MAVISVIIPVYNGEKTIEKTIESVLQQTFRDFELIVINDGSEDATIEVISTFQDHRLRLFSYLQLGASASRNRGIKLATGDYITFLDADDLWKTDKLEAQLKALQDNPHAAVAYSWTDYIDEQGNFLYPGKRVNFRGDVYSQILVSDFLENGSNALIRKQALTELKSGFDESLQGGEDWDILIRLAAKYQFVLVPSPQVLYRVSRTSASSKIDEHELDCLRVIERAFQQAPSHLQYLKKQSFSHLYTYLTFKCLQAVPERQIGFKAAHYFWQAVKNDPSILRKRWRLMLVVIVKIMVTIALPNLLSQTCLKIIKNWRSKGQ